MEAVERILSVRDVTNRCGLSRTSTAEEGRQGDQASTDA